MTAAEAERIGKAWLAAGAPWVDGMLDGASGDRASVADNGCAYLLRVDGIDSGAESITPEAWPDFHDPATVGAALGEVRKVWGSTAHLVRHDTHDSDGEGGTKLVCWWALAVGLSSVPFIVRDTDEYGVCDHFLSGPTEPEALIAAWAARPKGGAS